ncbi:hypothetical protein AX774_g3783 [Zancudomyces culisetae]|uniref:Copper transport protein n=1 Tax=Zancudomyces culisetae TaxID=1213189 RepID=A0A1R1PP29_ZANCU|nr:hypothetical protein AX774_g8025 [Zancudomyces culisetae]OMH79246.1 hypothetical protein AX774_g7348 [Zancudomyces culisetae]OMH82735.1 hypothetical protein AX774_g3783 [Zancudomyces culisetae]|eukprot:OMH78586.1 hypothetical protein AX774_g8025 [Zancudomyces culisetae]
MAAIYLDFLLAAYWLRTPRDRALACIGLILAGVVERLLSFGIDFIKVKRKTTWQIPVRAILYFVLVFIRYALMIAIMGGNFPIAFSIVGGLTLGFVIVDISTSIHKKRKYNKKVAIDQDYEKVGRNNINTFGKEAGVSATTVDTTASSEYVSAYKESCC